MPGHIGGTHLAHERMKKRWDPEAVVTRRQTELLDWIENELDKIP
jgi:hypothetical protein